jgi:hypothetical protein
MERSVTRPGGMPCRGCPIYPHIRDEEFRFPSCELCRWPAIGIGPVHAWRCAYCRHRNEHGQVRPRIAVAMLRLADLDSAALLLDVVDVRYGRYAVERAWLAPFQPRLATRPAANVHDAHGVDGASHGTHGTHVIHRARSHHLSPRERASRPVYARGIVDGVPVLIVGGDRPYPHPIGLAEHDPEPRSFSSRATRIACACDQPPPCLHAQALYAQVVSSPTGPAARVPAAPSAGGGPDPPSGREAGATGLPHSTGPPSTMPPAYSARLELPRGEIWLLLARCMPRVPWVP